MSQHNTPNDEHLTNAHRYTAMCIHYHTLTGQWPTATKELARATGQAQRTVYRYRRSLRHIGGLA